ncbi:MAG TPA: OmpA family protein [bacterium]|jgi:peptidoglycan-associated lipoprotein|nr:OmpA family protein [bacterium]MDX9805960.1 OmpA family protein [bacterium]HNW15895.1 OmpA family protein [bacterium]HNZ52689.1 OmpA family protein [bacterium]HOG44113.1 OmpA family protein [bacterium]
MKRFLVLLMISVLAGLTFSGCAKPPKAERELAEKAFKDALVGKDCDKENYLAAEELLNKAREEVNKKNYAKAKELFQAVKEKSDAIVKYYQDNPDKCLPKKKEVKKAQEEIEEIEDPATDPELEFPVIYFEFNEYTIRSEDLTKVDLISRWMNNFPEKVLRIEGHADERGSIDYNMSLGEKRADEVKNRLIQSGIDAKRVKIVSYGEERPADPASNESAWFKNRRAEFKRVN